jgi:D-amino-acid dehydrogenase
MRVAVMGAGLAGIAAAYALWRDGHEVVVVDRHPLPASETSYGNAGMVAPGHAYAWSSPAALRTLARALWRDDLALRFRFQADPQFWRWGWKFFRQCTSERAAANTARKVALCVYCQQELHRVVADTGVTYGGRSGGALYLFRTPETLARGTAASKVLRDRGVAVEAITPERVVQLDPVYAPVVDRFAGALFAPGDESGDARMFTRGLADWLAQRGVELRLGEAISRIEATGDRIARIFTDRGEITADAYVVALGCQSAVLGRTIGLDLPIYPIKGYSVTLPISPDSRPPSLCGVDEDNLFAFANYGDRVRLTAIAEFAGYDTSHAPEDFRTMLAAARELFPAAGDWSRPEYWAGLRPMTPDNLPIVGPTRWRNLWVDSGHGHMGWTWACGTGRVLADLMAGRRPEYDPEVLQVR